MDLLAALKQYIADASPGGLLNPEVPKGGPTEMAKGLLSFTPVVGDAISGYDAYQSAKAGNWGEAALNGLGLLPFVPSMAGIVKKLPNAPGESALPDGMVRLYHQTDANTAEKIGKDGLKLSKAKGIEGPKAIYADERGFYGDPRSTPTVEFYVNQDKWMPPYVMQDVPANQILGVHLPWHSNARYLLDPENKASLDAALSGRFDGREGDTAEAVRYVKEFIKQGQ